MHDLTVITTLAGALAFALALGWLTQRLGLSTLVGYLLAGVVVGPYTPGFVADPRLAAQMAEIGVILLMFSVGMHFHPQELLRVWRIALPGAVAQSALATIAGWATARAFGWGHGAGIVFGMALAVASTVVLMRMLVAQDRLGRHDGHVAVGWLIVEDLFTVVALVVLPALAVERSGILGVSRELFVALGKAAVFAVLVWIAGTRVLTPAMARVARVRSTELFTLAVFVVALGIALLATAVFNVSVALGAFFAGLVVGQSRFGPQAAADMLPFRDVFSALFFVSVGMLFNPALIGSQPAVVLSALAVVLIVKPLVALAIVAVLRESVRTGLTVAVGLAQIGEFSFILGALGNSLGVLPEQGMDVLIMTAIVSIALNPLLFRALRAFEARLDGSPPAGAPAAATAHGEAPGEGVGAPVLVCGLGEAGLRLIRRCAQGGVPVCAIDTDVDVLEQLRALGVATVFGDAGRPEVLRAAGLLDARVLVVANPALQDKIRVCAAARELNPRLAVIATAATGAERAWLEEFGAAYVVDVMDETVDALIRSVRSAL
ncbi:MAG TPA: cation:proton antiporter [Burkholderiales bacterium]|jgi:CPA2 family monovalent cation:H+ antiporter-2|nr:cation:proton antiporter [Burkholderiales bacterium]